ncbi:MAG: anthranilate synthase component I family protein, partial [Cellulosilyticaceae bacterium]
DAKLELHLKPRFSKDRFKQMVERTKAYIEEGDIFQAVISYPVDFELEESLFPLYKALRLINPSPYMYFMRCGAQEIAGTSPETLVKVKNAQVLTMPIAGTIKRGQNPEEDALLEQHLRGDQKENAEHRMLVDLARNDVGKVSQIGSVRVSGYQALQKLSHVMHLTSEVEGTLAASQTGLDALEAILPAGTLSGAPKVRAMEIIKELEQDLRGIYGGGIGMIEPNGNLDFCIAIRTFMKKGVNGKIQAGAGIVLDSDPEKEYQEVIQKLGALMSAVEKVGGTYDFNH